MFLSNLSINACSNPQEFGKAEIDEELAVAAFAKDGTKYLMDDDFSTDALDEFVEVWFGMVWYGMVWYGMVWYGI